MPSRIAPVPQWRQATVSAVAAGPPPTVTLDIDGGTAGPVRYLEPYRPIVGDVVWLIRNDSDLVVLGRLATVLLGGEFTESSTDIAAFTNTTPAAGTPVVGVAFVAGPSGEMMITVSGSINSASNTHLVALGWQLRQGATIGSGTIVTGYDAHIDRALLTSRAVNTGAVAQAGASRTHPVIGLTPGGDYNVQCMHWMDPGGTGNVNYRSIHVEPR